jgi:uncharacterized damage-inducible protein DinB
MNAIQGLISELEQESGATRRLLERVPGDKLGWKPHDKSMSLGQLALHVASTPGQVASMLLDEGMDAKNAKFNPPQAASVSEILGALEKGIERAKEVLGGMTPEQAAGSWKLTSGEREVFTMPRLAMARTIMFNHWYHHRGQLTVYLRLLDVPLPATYGRSADENPMA